ncbi:MAG: hypothetical protein ACI4D4_11465 [Lachnospira sp.]
MIRKNLLKICLVTMVVASFTAMGCGKKTEQTSSDNRVETTVDKSSSLSSGLVVSVKDSSGKEYLVNGEASLNEKGEKIITIKNKDGSETVLSATEYSEQDGKVEVTNASKSEQITVAVEKVNVETIASGAEEGRIEQAKEESKKEEEVTEPSTEGVKEEKEENTEGVVSGGDTSDVGSDTSNSSEGEHEHTWVKRIVSLKHEAETHEEQKWVVDQAAYDETIYGVKCVCECGAAFDTEDELTSHSKKMIFLPDGSIDHDALSAHNSGWVDPNYPLGTIHHDEVGHYETITVVDKKAYLEPVEVYKCSICGATKE